MKNQLLRRRTGLPLPGYRRQCSDEGAAPADCRHGADQRPGADLRRERHGQGTRCARIARGEPSQQGPFREVNCAAIPEELIESELFGHIKGSFTGATEDKIGKFQKADGGTLFLDEIGDMSLRTQSKVLRVLEEQRFERVGSNETLSVDVRVIAATNKHLEQEIARGTFRQDLSIA